MKVSIDLKRMWFMHKHESVTVVADLANLEMHNVAYAIDDPSAKSWLNYLSDAQMLQLYKATTNADTGYRGNYLRGILAELAERIPENNVAAFKLSLQSAATDDSYDGVYEYRDDATAPVKVEGYPFEPMTADKHPQEPSVGAARAPRYPALRSTLAATYAPRAAGAARVVAGNSDRPVQRPAGAPRTGGVREKIWNKADAMWEQAGKPIDRTAILELRKRIMDVLESDEGIKRTSSSNELGNWQKVRVAV